MSIPAWLTMNKLAALVVAVGFGASLAHVMRQQRVVYPDDTVVVRMGHAQLEAGYRDALQRVIDEYNELQRQRGHRVRVVQMAVNSRVFGQWLNTQMYAGSPPDLMQTRFARTTQNPAFVARFILPISGLINDPNPYNAGTELDGVPWKQTFVDNMRGAYNWALQDQYAASTTVFTNRVFVNVAILRRALGVPDGEPLPAIDSMDRLLEVCEAVKRLPPVDGRSIAPISAESGTLEDLYRRVAPAFMADFGPRMDKDIDGEMSYVERYTTVLAGDIDLRAPAIARFFEVLREITSHFPPGYLGLDREQALRRFRNGRAAMLITGSYDASTLFAAERIARERGEAFEVAAMKLPQFDPEGRWAGKVSPYGSEANTTGNVDFMIYKHSRAITPEKNWPLDFLHYLTSRGVNERFCAEISWIPIVRGAEPVPRLAPMMPDLGGGSGANVFPSWPSNGQYFHYLIGRMKAFVRGEIEKDTLIEGLVEQARSDGQFGMRHAIRDAVERVARRDRSMDRTLAAMNTVAAIAGEAPDRKYKRLLVEQVTQNAGENDRFWFEREVGEPLFP